MRRVLFGNVAASIGYFERFVDRLYRTAGHFGFECRCAKENVDHLGFLLQLAERELLDREARAAERRLKAARFPSLKTLENFDFRAQPSLNRMLVNQLMRGEYILQRESIILIGQPGTGKTHLATALGIKACQMGKRVRFFRVSDLITQLLESREGEPKKTARRTIREGCSSQNRKNRLECPQHCTFQVPSADVPNHNEYKAVKVLHAHLQLPSILLRFLTHYMGSTFCFVHISM